MLTMRIKHMPRVFASPLWGTVLVFAASAQEQPPLSQELHPSWDPTGTQLTFESNRFGSADIMVFDLEGGEARRLTSSPADDARPVWSPDGEWIAFHSNREGNHDLYVIRPDGDGLRRITSEPLDETNAGWSPTSTELVYEVRLEPRHWVLRILNLKEGTQRRFLENPGDHLTPFWLPGDQIAFTYSPPGGNHDTDVVLMLASPQGEILGTLLGGQKGNSNVHAIEARREIVFNSIRDGNWEIYTSLPGGEEEKRLTVQEGPELVGIDGQPAWSPTGDRIAITSGRAGSLDIVILSPLGEEIRNLTSSWRSEAPPGPMGGGPH